MNLRYAWRTYRRTPFFSIAATLVLGVAIAIATAIFSLYSHLQLQPVPGVRDSGRLVAIGLARDDDEWIPLNLEQYAVLEDALSTPDAVFGVSFAGGGQGGIIVDGNETDTRGARVSRGFFSGLGVPMLQGVDLDTASADPAALNAVISERLWEREFDREPRALGATVQLNEVDYTIVGIAGGGFRGLRRDLREDVWLPMETIVANMSFGPPGMDDAQRELFARRLPMISVYAMADVERLRSELPGATLRLRENWQSLMSSGLTRLEALPGSATNPRAYRTLMRQTELLAGGALLILLVASLNLASFFLSRAPARAQELRTRLALGATRGVIARQLFVESSVLVVVSAVLGLMLHVWARAALVRLPPFSEIWPRLDVGLGDWRVFAFLVAAAGVVAMVAGLVPAARAAFATSLTATTVGTTARRSGRLQPLLALQVLAATLVVLAGVLFVAELHRLENADYGFDADGLFVADIGFDREAMRASGGRSSFSPEQGPALMAELSERIGTLPGLDGFAAVSTPPLSANGFGITVVELPDVDDQRPEEERRTYHIRATSDYFRVIGMRVVGRPFDETNPFEAVVSREFARRIWGTEDVIGRQFRTVSDGGFSMRGGTMTITRTTQTEDGVETGPPPLSVVGITDDVVYDPNQPPQAVFYVPMAGMITGSFVVRGEASPDVVQPLLDEIVRKHMLPRKVDAVTPMPEIVRETFKAERARSRLAAGAALLALVLTMIGLYASMQHSVESRRGELAVRKALGATDDRLARLILRRALSITLLGVTGAALLAVVFRERIGELLFGLSATDLGAWAVSLAIVLATGLLAAWLPARRAGRVAPAVALRYE